MSFRNLFYTKTSRVDGKNGKFISSNLSPGAGTTRSYHDVMDVIIIGDIESLEINESSPMTMTGA